MADLLDFYNGDSPSHAAVLNRAKQMRDLLVTTLTDQRRAIDNHVIPVLADATAFLETVDVTGWNADQLNNGAATVMELAHLANRVGALLSLYDSILVPGSTPSRNSGTPEDHP